MTRPELLLGTIELPVESLNTSMDWYQAAFGCTVEWSDAEHALLAWTGQSVRFLLVTTRDPLRLAFRNASGAILHSVVDFQTTELERLHEHITSLGGQVEPLGAPANDWAPRGFAFSDPSGNRFGAFSYVR
jgi:predicted enzyme related to lactoylglutathione lyase